MDTHGDDPGDDVAELAAEVERLRRERAKLINAQLEAAAEMLERRAELERHTREEAARRLAYERGKESERINARLNENDKGVRLCAEEVERLRGSIEEFEKEVRAEFKAQADAAKLAAKEAQKAKEDARKESRKQVLQIVGAAFAATITAGGAIIVALITTSPS